MVGSLASTDDHLPELSFSSQFEDNTTYKSQIRDGAVHLRTVSEEPVGTAKAVLHSRGSQSVEIKGAARKDIALTVDQYDAWTMARAALSARKRKESRRQSKNSIHSVSALRHLCSKCQVFPLKVCMTSPQPGRVWTSPFKRLIWHRNDCPLCSLLMRALCQPENDPFQHPEVFPQLPPTLRTGSMEDWLTGPSERLWMNTTTSWENLEAWPFGLQILASNDSTVDSNIQEAAAQGFVAAGPSEDGHLPNDRSFRGCDVMITRPCYIAIINNTLTAGLLDVQLWGYGRRQDARIAVLSSFRLRIESDDAPNEIVSKVPPLAYGRIVDPGQIDLSVGRIWLDHCEQKHGASCSKQGWSFRLGKPDFFRLIDVEDLPIVEVTSSQAWSYRYLALSYVRGITPTFNLLQSNKHKLMRPHGLLKHFRNDLSRTLRDAINVTRGFEERYLWIDSLCIEYDNELDKRRQTDQIDRIFGNAVLTIVAADAQDADAGLCGVERGSRHIRQISEEIQYNVRIMLPLPPPKDLEVSPWAQRAWTFQERLFSRRLAFFTGERIHWRCHKCAASEDMTAAEAGHKQDTYPWLNIKPQQLGIKTPNDGYVDCSLRRLHDGTTHVMRSGTFKEYAQLIQQYSKRQIGCDSEALDAIAGLLHAFESCFKGPVTQGLPQVLLDAAILWRPAERLVRRDSTAVPSWSWAGWKGEVKYASAYQVQAKEDWSLQRVPSGSGQEWFRPLLRWYTWRDHQLQLLNGNGFGVPIEATTKQLPEGWEKYPPMMANSVGKYDQLEKWDNIMEDIEALVLDPAALAESKLQLNATILPPASLPLLGSQHLIFRTSCSKALRFGRISRSAVVNPKIPVKYPLLAGPSDQEIGSVRLDGAGPRVFEPAHHGFIVISEALYLEIEQPMAHDEKSQDFPLYNVMLVEWKNKGLFASRLGLGRIYKDAWKSLHPPPIGKTIILE